MGNLGGGGSQLSLLKRYQCKGQDFKFNLATRGHWRLILEAARSNSNIP